MKETSIHNEEFLSELVDVIIREHERAIIQRDKFLETGKSTASHGGSHDTCFRQCIRELISKYKDNKND